MKIRRQVVWLKELGKTGKEIEKLAGVRQNRASKIWTVYQREGSACLERIQYGRKPGSHMVLTSEEQENIRKAIVDKVPEDFGISGRLWTLGRTRDYIQQEFHKAINERTLSDVLERAKAENAILYWADEAGVKSLQPAHTSCTQSR